jgi:hypothetical protein
MRVSLFCWDSRSMVEMIMGLQCSTGPIWRTAVRSPALVGEDEVPGVLLQYGGVWGWEAWCEKGCCGVDF